MANQEFVEAMRAFNKLLNNKVLSENKSTKDKEQEHNSVNRLASAAMAVEELSSGQGLLGLCILAIRQALSLRDAGNILAYKLYCAEEKIKELESKVSLTKTDEETEKKEKIKKIAEEMGINISVE